jgi:outer membrane protein assembly factor BamB
MSKTRRACVVLVSHLALFALLAWQTADAAPGKADEVKKEAQKEKAPAKEDKAEAKDKAAKEEKAAAKEEKAAAAKEEAKAAKEEAKAADAAQPAAAGAAAAPANGKAAAPAGPPTPPEGELTHSLTLPSDRKLKQRLEVARDYIQKGQTDDWGTPCKTLQQVLKSKEDVFVQLRVKDANGREKSRWVSARAEANRLLGTMPTQGLETYQLLYGTEAKAKLDEARTQSDVQQLAQVALQYFHTDSGAEATDLLGTYYLDRGQPMTAALCYDRLLKREGAEQLSILTLFKAAYAFRLAGDARNLEASKGTWKKLAAKVGRDGFKIGDDTVTLEQLQAEMDRAILQPSSPFDWPLFRGNVSRSASTRGSAPFLRSAWQQSMLVTENPDSEYRVDSETKQIVEDALKPAAQGGVRIPAFYPLAAGGKVLFRSYWGIHARDLKTGELVWDSITAGSLNSMLAGDGEQRRQVKSWYSLYHQGATQNVIFENSTTGSLSADDAHVYAVDDLSLPPHPNVQELQMMMWGNGGMQIQGPLRDLAERSRLVAIEIETGKEIWERGDPKHDTNELTVGNYYLGPPLSLGGKLYILAEKNQELRLLCLEPSKGEPLWAQTLATTKDKMLMDPGRRVQAVHLAYADGILVCPTNAGAMLGVDLLTRSLVWAFPYREKKPEQQTDQQKMMMMRWGGMGPQNWTENLTNATQGWKMATPIIQDGKVIFTAADGDAIHCLDLFTGDSLWRADRQKTNDLYVGGLFGGKVVIVGKEKCRALSLADGTKQVWEVGIEGVPCGQGVICGPGPYYYLPVVSGGIGQDKKGEVCKLNLDTGKIEGRSPAPGQERPGNLLFHDGNVISQNESAVTCYPQIDAKLAEIDAKLKKNPGDPEALVSRGEMKLYDGKLADAVADLHEALKNNLPAKLLPATQARLYTTLTELMQLDFKEAKQYLDEYRELCKLPIPANATADERKSLEEKGKLRWAGYLCLFARGCEEEGDLVKAFNAYLEFGAMADADEKMKMLSIINEPSVKARPDVWARGRIAGLASRATGEQRKAIEDAIAARWKAVQDSKDPEALPRFQQTFGSLFAFAAGREAQLLLAKRRIEQNALVDAELLLDQLSVQREDRLTAARATLQLAQLMTRQRLMDDAVHYYRILGSDYADLAVDSGRTGAECLQELATDKRFWPYLDELGSPWAGAAIKAKDLAGGNLIPSEQVWYFDPKGDRLPFFHRHRLAWSINNMNGQMSFNFRLMDRDSNNDIWKLPVPGGRVTFNGYGNPVGATRLPYFTRGHLAVLYLSHSVYGLDLLERKVLWKLDLLGANRLAFEAQNPYYGGPVHMLNLDKDGALLLVNPQGTIERIGQIAMVTSGYVCLRTADGLIGIDPVHSEKDGTAKILWTKHDLSPYTHVFGDDQNVYLVDVREDQSIGSTRALRGRDGAAVEVPDFAVAFKRHQRVLGSRLLVSENDPTGGLVLRFYDVPSGKDLWKKNLSPDALVLRSEDPHLLGVVERNGKVTVVDLRTRQEVFHGNIKPAHLAKIHNGLLLSDPTHYYVTLNLAPEPNVNNMGLNQQMLINMGMSAGIVQTALRAENVNGMIYAFERTTGKHWFLHIPNQMLLTQEFEELPMLVFTSLTSKPRGAGFNQVTATMSVEKRTGKRIYANEVQSGFPPGQPAQYHALKINRQTGVIDLVSATGKLSHYLADRPPREALLQSTALNDNPRPWEGRRRIHINRPAQAP